MTKIKPVTAWGIINWRGSLDPFSFPSRDEARRESDPGEEVVRVEIRVVQFKRKEARKHG
jgi:hypothetical protein